MAAHLSGRRVVVVLVTLHFGVLNARASRCFCDGCLRILLHWDVAQVVRRMITTGLVSGVGSYARQMLRILTSGGVVALAQVLARLAGWSDHMMREHLFEGAWGSRNVALGGAEFDGSSCRFSPHWNISRRRWWVARIISRTYLWSWSGQSAGLLL